MDKEIEQKKTNAAFYEKLIRVINEKTFQIQKTKDYLETKIEQKDWHGVSDAANDIRDLEAEIKGIGFSWED